MHNNVSCLVCQSKSFKKKEILASVLSREETIMISSEAMVCDGCGIGIMSLEALKEIQEKALTQYSFGISA